MFKLYMQKHNYNAQRVNDFIVAIKKQRMLVGTMPEPNIYPEDPALRNIEWLTIRHDNAIRVDCEGEFLTGSINGSNREILKDNSRIVPVLRALEWAKEGEVVLRAIRYSLEEYADDWLELISTNLTK